MVYAGIEVSEDQPSEMQLAGRLALSVATFLFFTLAYRYYRSRVSASPQGRADLSQEAGQQNCPKLDGMDREETAPGIRYRQARKQEKLGRQLVDQVVHLDGDTILQGTPVGRELHFLSGKEEEVGRTEVSHLALLPDITDEEKGEDKKADFMRNSGTADVAVPTDPGGGPVGLLDPLSHESSSNSCNSDWEGPSPGPCSGKLESRLGPQEKLPERDPHPDPTTECGSSLEQSKGQPWGEDKSNKCLAPVQEAPVGQERLQSFHAASDMGLAISQSNTAYTFSSVAKVQVEEKFIKEWATKEGSCDYEQPMFPGASLRGKVYDYYVQSVSQSVSKEKPSYTPQPRLAALPFYDPSPVQPPNDSDARMHQESGDSFAGEDEEERASCKEILATSFDSLFPKESGKAIKMQCEEASVSSHAGCSQNPPRKRHSFLRKESFHQIVENPELQVQMEEFGSPTAGLSCGSAPNLSPLHSSSIASLVGSLQSLQSDASEEPTVEFVAGAKFFHIPLSSESSVDLHLDLGNCYEALCTAKKKSLEGLREAAYKVMSDNYLEVLRTNSVYGRLNAMERDLILQRRMRGRKYLTVADISSQDQHLHTSRLCYYNDQKDTWHPLTHVPIEAVSRGCAVCSMFNYLFLVAGCEGRGHLQKPSNRVFCYNPLTDIWREICPLNQARPQCKLVALEGCLYAIGGECLYTVERYDPRLDRWTFAAPLPNDTFAVAHTATVCDGEIYVTGGTLRYMLLRYVSRSDTWKITLTGGSKDRTTEMVTANGFIYRFDLNRSMGISVYRCSAKAKLWYECATNPMPFPACFQCAVIENMVYCVSRQFNLRFLADYISPRFGAKELRSLPSPRGSLFPITLVLPEREAMQTQV